MTNSKSAPLYQQIFEEIKGAIEAGDYVPKERIPSEPELSERYGAVSYTHLDVYKRQILSSLLWI